MENAIHKSEGVELNLPGIDKTWVRSNGEWRDKSTLNTKPAEVTFHDDGEDFETGSSSKWWKFWSRS